MRSRHGDRDRRQDRRRERCARAAARDAAFDVRRALGEIPATARQPLGRRRRRDPQTPRHVLDRAFLVIKQHEGLAIDVGDLAKRRRDDALRLGLAHRVVRGRCSDHLGHLDLPAPALAGIAREVARDPA